jgi:hypothetical protein
VAVAGDQMRRVLLRRGFALEYATLAWNVAGIVVLAPAAGAADYESGKLANAPAGSTWGAGGQVGLRVPDVSCGAGMSATLDVWLMWSAG